MSCETSSRQLTLHLKHVWRKKRDSGTFFQIIKYCLDVHHTGLLTCRVDVGTSRSNLELLRKEKVDLEASLTAVEARAKELERAVRDTGQRANAATLAAATTDAGRVVLEKHHREASSKANAALGVSVG